MKFSVPTDDATPKRMQNRKYVFAVSSLAAFLLIVAFIQPAFTVTVSRATITIPNELGAMGLDPIAERIQSVSFLRKVGERHGMATGATVAEVNAMVDEWVTDVRECLKLTEQPSSAANSVDLVLEYSDSDGDQSRLVMQSVLATLTHMNVAVGDMVPTQEAQFRQRAAERRAGQAQEALELFLAEELARLREEHIRVDGEKQLSVSLQRGAGPDPDEAPPSPTSVQVANAAVSLGNPAVTEQDGGNHDWLSDQKLIDEQNQRHRNPEYDAIARALVKSQSERQELLIRFSADHAAVRRVEVEIADLELLVSHTEKYLQDDEPVDRFVSLSGIPQPLEVAGPDVDFDEPAAIERIRQSETYQTLNNKLVQSRRDLQRITDPEWMASNMQRVVVSTPLELVDPHLAGMPWTKLLTVVTISSLLGFVVSRLGDSTSIPTEFYSIEDVCRSLNIPVLGQIEMDGTPDVPHPERIASVRFWHLGVRLAELLALLLVGAFVFALIGRPSLLSELFSKPLITYLHALQDLRSQLPLPYFF